MKTQFFNRTIAAIALLLFASQSFAASDYLLEIEGIKGECKGKHIKLTEQADGSFTAENIPEGTYRVVYTPKSTKEYQPGKPVYGNITFEGIVSPRDIATGQASGKRSSVQAPRDVATGQSSGKRQHRPFTITKEWNASTPTLILGQIIVGDVDGDGASDRTPGDPIPGLDVKNSTAASAPVKAGYDLKLNKKV